MTNNSRANLVTLCRSSSVYFLGGLGTEAGAGARVGVQETAKIGTGVPLSWVGASPALRRMRGPAIWTRWVNSKGDDFCSSEQAGWPVKFGVFRIVIGSTQYYTTRLNRGGDAQREQKKNCYVTWRIGVGLRTVKRCSIDRTWLIKYYRVKSRVRLIGVPELIHNREEIDVWV